MNFLNGSIPKMLLSNFEKSSNMWPKKIDKKFRKILAKLNFKNPLPRWCSNFDFHFWGIVTDTVGAFVQLVFGNDNNVRTIFASWTSATIGTTTRFGSSDDDHEQNDHNCGNQTANDSKQDTLQGNCGWKRNKKIFGEEYKLISNKTALF